MPQRRRLRSVSTKQLDVPTCRRSTIGGRAFPVAGAKVWNGLPSEVTSASWLSVFKNRLKTYLFRHCYETVWLSITFLFPSHYLPPQNSGPCNSFNCLGHFKNVYDDDEHCTKHWNHWLQFSGSSEPSRQSFRPSQYLSAAGMHSPVYWHRNWSSRHTVNAVIITNS